MDEFRKISILGVGLIGGSLALAWKHAKADIHITGFASPETLEKAKRRGAVDSLAASVQDAVRDADLVVLASPVSNILATIPTISGHLKAGALVTDVGGVKAAITERAAEEFSDDVYFIGGHPMAGSEREGIEAADPFLFQNAVYVLCPQPNLPDGLFRQFASLIDCTGARILLLQPDVHDRIAAAVSHLPQMLAVALINMVGNENENDSRFLQLAAGGFRDLTRIASSPFGMWSDILETNTEFIKKAIDQFIELFQEYKENLDSEKLPAIDRAFQKARRLRDSIPRDTKGFLRPLVDVFVQVEDRPGVISEISTALYRDNINIKDIELLKIREGTGGTFRLSFESESIADRAVAIINSVGHEAFRK